MDNLLCCFLTLFLQFFKMRWEWGKKAQEIPGRRKGFKWEESSFPVFKKKNWPDIYGAFSIIKGIFDDFLYFGRLKDHIENVKIHKKSLKTPSYSPKISDLFKKIKNKSSSIITSTSSFSFPFLNHAKVKHFSKYLPETKKATNNNF